MPRGSSGRIVIEIDPALKQDLYVILAKRNMTLKDWFIQVSSSFLSESMQNALPFDAVAESSVRYTVKREKA